MDREIDQSPFLFNLTYFVGDHTVEYKNLLEVCQGGPVVGDLYIDGKQISCSRYGGPILYDNQFIYVPMFSGAKFIISKIQIANFETSFVGNHRDIIHLKKLDHNKIYFYDSIYDNTLRFYDLTYFNVGYYNDTPCSLSTQMNQYNHSYFFDQIKEVSKDIKIARLNINGKTIDCYQFGFPFLYNDSYILIPVFITGFLRSGFKLALINIIDLSIKIFGKKEKFISLISFENCNKIIYYADLAQTSKKVLNL